MRQQGIYIAPSQFEALFLSAAHMDEHIDVTINAAQLVLKNLGK
jgi:glutamate-1-semialdehyde 2,1-aminomutase